MPVSRTLGVNVTPMKVLFAREVDMSTNENILLHVTICSKLFPFWYQVHICSLRHMMTATVYTCS